MLTTDDVDVQMVDALASLSTIIDHSAISTVSKALLCGHLRRNDHQMAKKSYMAVFSPRYASEPVAVLRDDEEMFGSHGCNITES